MKEARVCPRPPHASFSTTSLVPGAQFPPPGPGHDSTFHPTLQIWAPVKPLPPQPLQPRGCSQLPVLLIPELPYFTF